MDSDVRDHIRKCDTCCFSKGGKHVGEMHVPANGFRPWSVVAVDIVDLEETASGNREAAVFCCRYTREVMCFPVPHNVDSEMFLNILALGVLPVKGRIHVLYSDRGSILISKLCQAYYMAMGIENRPADSHMHTVVGNIIVADDEMRRIRAYSKLNSNTSMILR